MRYKLNISNHPKRGFSLEFQYNRKPKEVKGLRRCMRAWALKLLGLQ
ncbi:hypothetical protein [Solibacillus isronensis]